MASKKQVLWQIIRNSGAACVGLALAGCASVVREAPQAPAATNAVASAAAATNAPPADGYDWDALAHLAAANGSEAKALLLEAEAERHKTAVDTGWRNPQLRYGHHWGSEDGEKSAASVYDREWEHKTFDGAMAGLRIFTSNPFVNRWLRKGGEATAKALEAAADKEAYAVYCEVRTLCLEAEMLREEIALLGQAEEIRTALRDVRRDQAEAGVVSPVDLIRAETRLAALRAELLEKQTARKQLIRRIAVLASVPAEQIRLRPRAQGQRVAPQYLDVSVLTEFALLRRPDLVKSGREQEAAAYGVEAAKAGQIPWFEYVEGSYEGESESMDTHGTSGSDATATSGDRDEWTVRVAVTLPVFNWLGDEVKLSRARLAAASARARGLDETVRAEVGGVLEDYKAARAESDRQAGECGALCASMTERINALAKEPSVRREDILAAREELVAYRRVCLNAEHECLRLEQYLETVSGGSLTQARQ